MGKLGKHDHKLTNILKACIFSLIMLAPLIGIGVSCLYVVNNKNAYQSYYGETINEEKYIVNGNQDTNIDTYYYLNMSSITYTQNEFMFISNFELVEEGNLGTNRVNLIQNNASDLYRLYFYSSNGNFSLEIDAWLNNQIEYITYIDVATTECIFKFKTTTLNNDYTNQLYYIEYNDYSYLDNVFYYSIHNLEEQSTFNWVQNTAIYTPLNAMCRGLGITESAIPILLCYWSLMTAIYIVFDIIIYLFTKLTHLIGTN